MVRHDYTEEVGFPSIDKTVPWPMVAVILVVVVAVGWLGAVTLPTKPVVEPAAEKTAAKISGGPARTAVVEK